MSICLPFTNLAHHPTKNLLILCFGCYFHAVNTSTGLLIASTFENLEYIAPTNSQIKYINSNAAHGGVIRSVAFSPEGSLMASTGEDKVLKVWDLEEWKLNSSRPVPKRVVALAFTKDGSQILTADKFGDVYSFTLHPSIDVDNSPQLLMGHVSMVTDMTITSDNKYLITADRDEHIRVSHFPNAYNIESYCLGHTHFLSKIHVLPWATDLLLSGGGDDFIALWDFILGKLLQTLDIKQYVTYLQSDEETEGQISIMGMAINSLLRHVALVIENFPGILILTWNKSERHFLYHATLSLDHNPLDAVYDLSGNLWVSSTFTEFSGNHPNFVTLFKINKNHEYLKIANDHPLVVNINRCGSMSVDSLPELYPIGQLRKAGTDWRVQHDKGEHEEGEEDKQNINAITGGGIKKGKKLKRK